MTYDTSGAAEARQANGLRSADFGTRFSAFMIDALLLFAAQWMIFIVLSRQFQAVGLTSTAPCSADSLLMCEGPSNVLWAVLLVLLFVSTIGYYAAFEGLYGATPGKRWMGLEVVGTDGERPIGLARAALRAVVRQAFWLSLFFILDASPLAISLPPFIFIAVPLLALAPLALVALSDSGIALHDTVASTIVVRSDSAVDSTSTESTSIESTSIESTSTASILDASDHSNADPVPHNTESSNDD